jgi:hypothetical protein
MCRVTGLAATWLLSAGNAQSPPPRQVLGLEECLKIALENNHRRPASRLAVTMAEAQHRQALAGYWPQVSAKAGISLMDEAQNFIFPGSQFYIPPQSITTPAGSMMVSIPANAFFPGVPPTAVQMPVSLPSQTVTTGAQFFPVPAQNIKLISPRTEAVNMHFDWLL